MSLLARRVRNVCLGVLPEGRQPHIVQVLLAGDGQRLEHFPAPARLERATPVYESLPGWRADVRGARAFCDLPGAAREYVLALEDLCGVEIAAVSVGPRREELIWRQ